MEYTVTLGGNVPTEAARGASALREEGAAARETTGALAGFRGAASALSSATQGAAALAAGMKEAQREASTLKAARDALANGGEAVDIDTFRALSTQLEAATGKASALAAELARTGQAGRDFDGEARAAKALQAEQEKSRKIAEREAEQHTKAGVSAKSGAASALGAVKEIGGAVLKATAAVIAYGAALAGIHGIDELTRMAVGWRAMGQLQMLSWKATMDLRRAVMGVDASPVVRGFTALEKNLSQSTVTGRALSGILTRGFNALFSTFEKLVPLATAAFEYMVIGALEAEVAWLKLRIALAPLEPALENLGGAIGELVDGPLGDLTGAAAEFTKFALSEEFKGIAADARIAAEAAKALASILREINAAGGGAALRTIAEGAIPGIGAFADANKKEGAGAAPTPPIAATHADGRATGKALGDGMVQGMGDTGAAVEAAGRALSARAVSGARAEAGAHSPADKTIALGHDLDAGAVVGMRQGAGGVQAEAERSLVPDVGGLAKATGAGGAGGGGGAITIQSLIGNLTIEAKGGGADDIRAAVLAAAPELAQAVLRLINMRAGLPVPGTS